MSVPCEAAGVGFHRTGLGHQWLSILWHKELASCCTCYARGVKPLIHRAERILEEIKIHYSLVLPRKIVEQSIAKAEVRTERLQENTKH